MLINGILLKYARKMSKKFKRRCVLFMKNIFYTKTNNVSTEFWTHFIKLSPFY